MESLAQWIIALIFGLALLWLVVRIVKGLSKKGHSKTWRKELESLKKGDKIEISDIRYYPEAIFQARNGHVITALVHRKYSTKAYVENMPKTVFKKKIKA